MGFFVICNSLKASDILKIRLTRAKYKLGQVAWCTRVWTVAHCITIQQEMDEQNTYNIRLPIALNVFSMSLLVI